MTVGDWAYKVRVPIGFALSIAFLALARPSIRSLVLGASVAVIGLGIRAWAAGHIRKNDQLAITGPYAHTRNPLYLGSFLMASGFAYTAHWTFLVVVAAFFVAIYVPTMARERHFIAQRFPREFEAWAHEVPAFLPRLTPWRPAGAESHAFSAALYMRHGEWKAALGFLAVVIWLWLRASGRV